MSEAAISVHDLPTRFWRDRTGAVAMLPPVLIGFAGIGIEVGLWYAIQRQNRSAADAAAISAALEYAVQFEQPGVATDSTAAATTAASCTLFRTNSSSSNPVCTLPSSASNTITLYPCYGFTVGSGSCNTSNSNGGPPNAVQVVLTQPLNTTFATLVTAIWGPSVNTVNVTTTAIAAFPMLPNGQTCLLALQQTGTGIAPIGNHSLMMPNCEIVADSTANNPPAISNAGNGCVQTYSLPRPDGYSSTRNSKCDSATCACRAAAR